MDEDKTEPWSPDELMVVNGIKCVYTYWIGRYWVHLPGMQDALTLDQMEAFGFDVVLPKFPRTISRQELNQQKELRRISVEFKRKCAELGI
jgi:hypothetical protein